MGGIFGCVDFGDRRLDVDAQVAVRRAMHHWGPAGLAEMHDAPAWIGRCRSLDSPESASDRTPLACCGGTVHLTADARLDNREELCAALDIAPSEQPVTADTAIIARAYEQWGAACVERLCGDWSFAAWDRQRRRLFLARDQHGMTSLYYFHDGSRFAFASDKRALLPLLRRPPTLDEDYVAEILIVWPAGHADKTPYREIRRLCPAHVLDADDSSARLRLYWSLDHVPDVRLGSHEDYAEAALEILRRATASRLRSDRPTAISLSGGLDSAAVAAVAAPILADRGESLTAFTSVPLYAVAPGRGLSGDEFRQAGLTAGRFHNIEHVAVRAEQFSPVRGVREMLRTHGEPGIAPANQFWLNAINHAARDRRVGRLFSGQHGNGTISWAGLPGLASVAAQLRLGDPRRAGGEVLGIIRRWVAPVLSRPRASGSREASPWRAYSAINPDLSARLRIGQRLAEADDAARTPRGRRGREERLRYIRPGVDMSGCRRAHVGAAFGFVAADPTRDVRLIELIQGMPDWVFRGEFDRHLARAMTARLLPTEVRLQTAGGQQAADLLERLRQHTDEQHELLAAISASPLARALIDVPYVESVHREVVSTARNDQVLLRQAQSVLMSGLAVGAFVRACDHAAARGEVELSL